MTVSSLTSRIDYIGNGLLTTYAYNFKIFAETDLLVYVGGTLKSWPADFSVTGVGSVGGGNVIFALAPGAVPISIVRSVAETQLVDYVANDAFPAETHEAALDRLTMICQQLTEALGRTIQFDIKSLQSNKTISDLVAGKLLRARQDLSGIEMVDIADLSATSLILPVSITQGGTGATTLAGAQANLGIGGSTPAPSLGTTGAAVNVNAGAPPVAGTVLTATDATHATWQKKNPSVSAALLSPTATRTFVIWRAPFACTVLSVQGFRANGTAATINAVHVGVGDLLAGDLNLTSNNTWMDGGAVQNVTFAAGDTLSLSLRSVSGTPDSVTIQVGFSKP